MQTVVRRTPEAGQASPVASDNFAILQKGWERMGDTTLRELVYGKGAHVDPLACVEDISADLAQRTVAGYPHSIWQILEHMNYWMDYDLAKIAGENPCYPNQAIESWPAHPSPADEKVWKATTRRFTELLARLATLAESDAAVLERNIQNAGSPQSPRESTVHTMVWQIAVHNSYHVGQIALLRRQAGAWPPERGGDTW
jgi:uncharacterized damage-inducible protein DinB